MPVNTKGDLLKTWMTELDGYFEQMENFREEEPDVIFADLSAWTARASHMRSIINRNESRTHQNFRIKQIDPFISECDRQFKVWSRVFSVQSMDFNMNSRVT